MEGAAETILVLLLLVWLHPKFPPPNSPVWAGGRRADSPARPWSGPTALRQVFLVHLRGTRSGTSRYHPSVPSTSQGAVLVPRSAQDPAQSSPPSRTLAADARWALQELLALKS